MSWGAVIAAGASLVSGLIQDEREKEKNTQSKENLILELQDNERDRQAQADRQAALLASNESIAGADREANLLMDKRRILGQAILDQGEDQGQAMLRRAELAAQTPERFNTAANALAASLLR